MEEVWKTVLHEIQIEVSPAIFHTFFSRLKLVSIDDNIASISAPTRMTSEYIEKRYYALIKTTLDKKTGGNNSLVFTTHSQSNSTPKEEGPLFSRVVHEKAKNQSSIKIRTDYTFTNFAVSESNQLAYTAAQTVASNPGGMYNPLFIYGSVGVGKTHLMCAIANTALRGDESFKIAYLTTEEFTNDVVEAIRNKTTNQMRKKFRSVDLLLLDDVQFLSGKERVQEELFHTFNTLIDRQKQIVFTSDRPPEELKKIEARLASRFGGGLTVDIQPPDFELRTAILLIKAEKYGLPLTVDMAKQIAENIEDVRSLEGFLLKLASVVSSLPNKTLEKGVVNSLIRKKKISSSPLHPDTVINVICDFYNIKSTQLKGSRRTSSLVKARHVCMYLLKLELGLSFVEIGNLLGGRDHTTVMHGVDKVGKLLSDKGKQGEEILLIKRQIQEEANE